MNDKQRIQMEFEARSNRLLSQEEEAKLVAEDIEAAFGGLTKQEQAAEVFKESITKDARFMDLFGQPMTDARVEELQAIVDSHLMQPKLYVFFPRLVAATVVKTMHDTLEIKMRWMSEEQYSDREVLEFRTTENLPNARLDDG